MKRIISFVLVFAMLFSFAVPAHAEENFAISMTADRTQLQKGETVTLTVSANKTVENVGAFQYQVIYDPELVTYTSSTKGAAYSGTVIDKITSDGVTYIQFLGLDNVNVEPFTLTAGEIGTVTFTVNDDVTADTVSFTLRCEAMDDYDNGAIAVTVPEAPITVSIAAEPECEHTYVAGICTLCNEADPDYEAPSVNGILSLSRDAEYMVGPASDEVMVFKPITVPYFDLGLYGLEEYYFVSESYSDDGDGLPGSDLEPGTAAYADGKVTMLHLLIYALEVYYYDVPEKDAGKGYLYEEGLIGTEAFTIQGGTGSSFMTQFWGGDCNLNYYVNYEYPLASDGWGATVDQILLRDGDLMTLGNFSNYGFYSDPYSIFNYIVADNDNPTEGEEITLKLYVAGPNMGTSYETAQIENCRELAVYYVPVDEVADADVTAWTKLGTTDANGELVVDTGDLGAGEYIVAVAGQSGDYTDEICSTPGGLILTIEECDHDYTDGICGNCGAADPNYVPPSNDYVIYSSETGFQAKYTQSDAMITEVVLKGAKDKVLAVNNSENDEAYGALYPYIFLDGDKVQLGDTFEFGIKTIGDDQVTVESAVVELNREEKSPWVTIRFVDNESANIGGTLCLLKTFTLEGATMNPGEEKELKLTTNLVDRQKKLVPILEWASSDTSVATVSGGKVTAVAPGTTTITATVGTKTATCTVTVECGEHSFINGVCEKCGESNPDYVAIESIEITSHTTTTVTDVATGQTVEALPLTVGGSEKLIVTLNEGANQGITWTVENHDDKEGDVVSVENGVVTALRAGTATITATAGGADVMTTFAQKNTPVQATYVVVVEEAPATGFTLTMPGDFSITADKSIEIPVALANTEGNNYNAFDVTITYPAGLSFSSVKDETLTVAHNEEARTVNVKGYGEPKTNGTAAFTLVFEAEEVKEYVITASSAKVNNSAASIEGNAPDAKMIDDITVVTVTGFNVTLPDGFGGETTVVPGADYTFTIPTDNYDYTVTVKVGDTVLVNGEKLTGSYTIKDVTGSVEVTAEKTGKFYNVDLGDHMTGADQAQFGADYVATLDRQANTTYGVEIRIGGTKYTGFKVSGDTYTIPGNAITGDVQFVVTATSSGESGTTMHTVKFDGTGAGAAPSEAQVVDGADYTFELTNMETGYTYVVSLNGSVIEAVDGKYTVKNVKSDITIMVNKALSGNIAVQALDYVTKSSGQVKLIVVTGELADGSIFTYGGKEMYFSSQYNAWVYLDIAVGETAFDGTTARAKVATMAGSKADQTIAQTYDVNGSGTVDINDAQLAYDIYKPEMHTDVTTENAAVSVLKFLNADVNGDKTVTTADAAAVVAQIK